MKIFHICFGIVLVVLGIIIIKFGDKEITSKYFQGGMILRIFSQSYLNPKLLKWQRVIQKWGIGLVAIWFGLWLIFNF